MTNILKFQTKEEKAKVERLSLTFHVQTDILDDGSVWYRYLIKQGFKDTDTWSEWRKVDE